jgi:alpha-acetolactate decarboxylase
MKRLFVAFVFMLIPTMFYAQTAFAKFEDKTDVTSVVVNKKMFQLMGQMKMDPKDKDAQQYLNLVKKLDNLKVFTTSSSKHANEMKSTVDGYLKSNPLEELMRINNDGKNIKIFVKSGTSSSQVKELLMFMEGNKTETVLMSLTGNFDLNDISVLTEKMSLPGGPELKKAAAKKQ